MKNLSGKLFGISYLKIIALLFAFFLLLVFSGFTKLLNNEAGIFLTKIGGESTPDSNIVIINITENDIAAIGPWPIKRSYYALLIRSLSELKVKSIGLEVFLSARFATQSVYDNLLTKEIEKAGNVVLSSTAGSVHLNNSVYTTDSLSYPTPKLLDEKLKSGHLNFIEDDPIKIPLVIKTRSETEKAFSLQLSGENLSSKEIEVNLFSSWKKFRSYSLLNFFDLYRNQKESLGFLKDKIVLVGTSDPQLAFFVASPFDDEVPGVALHAFAIDNILNGRWINNNYSLVSSIIFLLFLCFVAFYTEEKSAKRLSIIYVLLFILILALSLILLKFFFLKLSYSYFLIPFLLLAFAELVLYISKNRSVLIDTLAEAEALKSVLKSKEGELTKLQNELDVSSESPQLLEKIKALKEDINRLKEKEEDQSAAEININKEPENFYGIVYKSKVMANLIDFVKRTAPEEANILILGESGTGKELIAKAIHTLSKRNDKNFVAVNCGALSDSLLESELFGHVKGAFTGAVSDKTGRFEAADNGTIFLDEIAETSENFQVKLLRVLQTGDFEKVGSSKTEHVNLRIIAATNKDLENAVKEKKFREDLYYRLNVIKIELPPLRDRKDDIEVLVNHFVKKESKDFRISNSAYKSLNEYQWKGNIRELEAVIKRASILVRSSGRSLIQLSDLPKEIVKETSIDFDDLVLESLRHKKFSHSSITETAKELGNVSRTLVSENFRGYCLKILVENDFHLANVVNLISGTDDAEVNDKVKNKIETFIQNIENDVKNISDKNFETVKSKLISKYKNLPQRFHFYLDEMIKHYL
jgi:transcriptional regulator with GAF, ATPase, and Fis domain/CHASE2 domain-containing sensor protein